MGPGMGLMRVMAVHRKSEDVTEPYACTYGPLVGLLMSIGGSASDAEEVAQDAFVKVLGHWGTVGSFDDPDQLTGPGLCSVGQVEPFGTGLTGPLRAAVLTP